MAKETEIKNDGSEQIGNCLITYETIFRPDGLRMRVTNVKADKNSSFEWLTDPRFRKPIVTEPGGLLIDQTGTTKAWGGTPGRKPEDFLAESEIYEVNVGFDPTNWGWQKGAFGVDQGNLVLIPNDSDLSGVFEVLCLSDNGWEAKKVSLHNGQPDEPDAVKAMKLGFSMPAIVKDGSVVGQMSIWQAGDLRAMADPRNWVDLAAGSAVPSRFWTLVRKVMPSSPAAARRVTQDGRSAVMRVATDMTVDELQEFQEIIRKADLEQHWQIIGDQDKPARVVIRAVLPANRIPAIGMGIDRDNRLIVTAVDGRQPESSGATIDELAEIMKSKGAVWAGLGAAGGDVALVANTRSGIRILNSPANLDSQNNRVTRPVPSVLVIN